MIFSFPVSHFHFIISERMRNECEWFSYRCDALFFRQLSHSWRLFDSNEFSRLGGLIKFSQNEDESFSFPQCYARLSSAHFFFVLFATTDEPRERNKSPFIIQWSGEPREAFNVEKVKISIEIFLSWGGILKCHLRVVLSRAGCDWCIWIIAIRRALSARMKYFYLFEGSSVEILSVLKIYRVEAGHKLKLRKLIKHSRTCFSTALCVIIRHTKATFSATLEIYLAERLVRISSIHESLIIHESWIIHESS